MTNQITMASSTITQVRQVTVLYGDWNEFAQLPENTQQLAGFLETLENGLDEIASAGGGLKMRRATSFLAFWGMEETLVNEAESAVRFALRLRDMLQDYTHNNVLPIKLVLTTGEFTVGGIGQTEEGFFKGEAIDLCYRLPALIPDGGVAVAESTFRKIEGLFSIRPLGQVPVLGRDEPVSIYRVLVEKAIKFQLLQHGVEGVATRFIGRELELKQLRDVYEIAADERDNHLVTVIGEAGTGKSRLLLEIERWRDLIPESTRLFRAQASADMLQQPYALLRRILMNRFGIQDSDLEDVAFDKTLVGVEGFMGKGHHREAQLLAQLVGLPCPDCEVAEDSSSLAIFEQRALQTLAGFFRAVDASTQRGVISLNLEDMHWADDKSLDAILWLLRENARSRLVVIVLARPELLDRRPRWGLEQSNSIRMDLHTLPVREARKLAREVLQKLESVPDALLDWMVERSGGNPLYIEELLRSLIATGVVRKSEGGQPWTVDLTRLQEVRIPDTLTGLLQIQLSNLPAAQRIALQRASVIGRSFWDAALAALASADDYPLQLTPVLSGLSRRNLIFRQERSSFAGLQEYSFISNLMLAEAYHSIPEAIRCRYHSLAAEWLQQVSGQAPAMASRIADHFERAGQGLRAVPYLALAAEEARRLNAFGQMRQFLRRAVSFAQQPVDEDHEISGTPSIPPALGRATLLYRLGETMILMGESAQALPYLQEALQAAREDNDKSIMAEVLGRLGWAAYYAGDYLRAAEWLQEGADCARQSDNRPALLLNLRQLGNVVSARSDFFQAKTLYEESLQIAGALNDQSGVTMALNNLGLMDILTGNYIQAGQHLQETIRLADLRGDRMAVAIALGNLGIADYLAGDYEQALKHLKQAIEMSRSVGSQLVVAESLVWMGICSTAMGDFAQAQMHLREGLRVSLKTEQTTLVLGALVGFANLAAAQGAPERAVQLLALTLENPALDDLLSNLLAKPLLGRLHAKLTPQAFGLAWANGVSLVLDDAIRSYQ